MEQATLTAPRGEGETAGTWLHVPTAYDRWDELTNARSAYRAALWLWNAGGRRVGALVTVMFSELAGGVLPTATTSSARRTILTQLVGNFGLARIVERWQGGAVLEVVDPEAARAAWRRLRLADEPVQQCFDFAYEQLDAPVEEGPPRESAGRSPGGAGGRVFICDDGRAARPERAARDGARRAERTDGPQPILAGRVRENSPEPARGLRPRLKKNHISTSPPLHIGLVREEALHRGGSPPRGRSAVSPHPDVATSRDAAASPAVAAGSPRYDVRLLPQPPDPLALWGKLYRSADSLADAILQFLRSHCGDARQRRGPCLKAAWAVEDGQLRAGDLGRLLENAERSWLASGRKTPAGRYFNGALQKAFLERGRPWDSRALLHAPRDREAVLTGA